MRSREPSGTRYLFDIFADYHHVYLEDCQFVESLSEALSQEVGETPERFAARMQALAQDADRISSLLSPEARARHLGVADSTLCILTARMLDVPVTLELRESRPADDWADWDRVVEASVDLPWGVSWFMGQPKVATTRRALRSRPACIGREYTTEASPR